MPSLFLDLLLSLKQIGEEKVPDYNLFISHIRDKRGIEIGGPSNLFKKQLPVYQSIKSLDGVNYSNQTIWEGSIQAGYNFNYIGKKRGFQFISDTTNLDQIESNKYDFLLSSNCLEHIANPFKAIAEWKRVIKNKSALILVLPNKESNFDHNRPVTTFKHLLDDYYNNVSEYDLTHLDEILSLHDLSMDLPAGDWINFKKRSLDNFNNRTLHHHVFDSCLINKMLTFFNFKIIKTITMETNIFSLSLKQ